MRQAEWKKFLRAIEENSWEFRVFMEGVNNFFLSHPKLQSPRPAIHSSRMRMKDTSHLKQKIERKRSQGRDITPENLFDEVTDIAGVRLLLLFQSDFNSIDDAVRNKVQSGDWVLKERPKAFTWDPENRQFFERFDLSLETRDTSYTSVHYLLKPRADAKICCEVQVRTLFEEIWGEVDHLINYPQPTRNLACREQLKVLSKIVGAGSRLVDSIERTMFGK